jgi:hypothetical protein
MSEFSEGMAVGQSIGQNNNCGGWGNFGGDGWWILLLLLCGWGNNGWTGNGGGNQMVGYELGRVATTNDVASGFSTSAIMGNINDIMLTQQSGFAGVQQTLCQGFSGINQAISNCCCETNRNIDNLRYQNERNTCDIQKSIDCVGDRIIGYLTNQEITKLRDELQTCRFRESQANQNAYFAANQEAQTAELIRRLGRDNPVPAYVVPNPNCCYQYNPFNGGNCCNGNNGAFGF